MRLNKSYWNGLGDNGFAKTSGNHLVDDVAHIKQTPRAGHKEMQRREGDFWEQEHKMRCPVCFKRYHYHDKDEECKCR